MAAKKDEVVTFLDTQASNPVTFADVEEIKAVSLADLRKEAEAEVAARPIRVKVNKPYRVVHEGCAYTGGDVVAVPPALADTWIRACWADRVKR